MEHLIGGEAKSGEAIMPPSAQELLEITNNIVAEITENQAVINRLVSRNHELHEQRVLIINEWVKAVNNG